MRAATMCS
ncbi:unnamed protein product [Linum tenue]|uniref:Uncharacterized protein n=1 Tax=Linum tenue TaxID=586396 RepID=A0AAV0KSQ7_9ROSI|nr:unnamed protein product [Linum tenue]